MNVVSTAAQPTTAHLSATNTSLTLIDAIRYEDTLNVPEDVHWSFFAACKGQDQRLFYPAFQTKIPPEVRQLCQRCPVRTDCLNEALANDDQHGIWGGLSPDQRQRLSLGVAA